MESILVSACLLGVSCRYDAKSKPNENVIGLIKKYNLIPVCPEILGGMATPRLPSERKGNKVVSKCGDDVTKQFVHGAEETLRLANMYGCKKAVLKEKSPSCGFGKIYDGTFSRKLINGNGVAADLLSAAGIAVFGENSSELIDMVNND